MNKKSIIIATRKSPLALWQAYWVKNCLETIHPHLAVELLGLTTLADDMPLVSLKKVGGKGLFVKELEEALLASHADIAVHSLKDVPMDLPQGLCLPVVCQREDPRDVLVSNTYQSLADLPVGACVGTSSLRRQSQLLVLRPDIEVSNLRGNVNTRLQRLDEKKFDAIILAAAGLKRLGLENRIRQIFSASQFLPAAGQGILGIECREQDEEVQALIMPLNDVNTFICLTAERAMCKRLGGGCYAPIAAYAEIKQNKLVLRGLIAQIDGSKILQAQQENHLEKAEALGIAVANDLIRQGANEILQSLRI